MTNEGHAEALVTGIRHSSYCLFFFTSLTVLDPFGGLGFTVVAALRLGRNSIGIEINLEFCRMAERFLKDGACNFAPKVKPPVVEPAIITTNLVREEQDLL